MDILLHSGRGHTLCTASALVCYLLQQVKPQSWQCFQSHHPLPLSHCLVAFLFSCSEDNMEIITVVTTMNHSINIVCWTSAQVLRKFQSLCNKHINRLYFRLLLHTILSLYHNDVLTCPVQFSNHDHIYQWEVYIIYISLFWFYVSVNYSLFSSSFDSWAAITSYWCRINSSSVVLSCLHSGTVMTWL